MIIEPSSGYQANTKPNIFGDIGEALGISNPWSHRNYNEQQVQRQNAMQQAEAEKNRQFNAQQADLAWSRQNEARSNAIQTQMHDLEKAGINPMLAGSLGGATLPSVSSGSSSAVAQMNRAEAPDYMKQVLGILGKAVSKM